jgi:EAL and modified HD-GYP domain-containing signal transduction protein
MRYFISRQAIFDKDINVIGYEIVIRDGFSSILKGESSQFDPSKADSAEGLSNLFSILDINTITSYKKPFIHFSPTLLEDRIAMLFSWEHLGIIVDTPESYEEQVIDSCLELKRRGYTIILDKFNIRKSDERYISVASYIRLSAKELDLDTKSSLLFLKEKEIKLLASQVDSSIQFNNLVISGFSLFQGNFYSTPQIIPGNEIPAIKIHYFKLMREVLKPEIHFTVIEDIINKDPALSYKLLKIVNSAAFGLRKEITSIRQALVIVGANEIKKWVSLITVGHLGNDKPDELLKRSLFRASFCELMSNLVGLSEQSSELFFMGMFSLIDAFVDKPLDEVLNQLPISEDITEALLKNSGPFAQIYSLLIQYEACSWDDLIQISRDLQINPNELPNVYFDALEWVKQIFS